MSTQTQSVSIEPILDPPYLTVWDLEKINLTSWRNWFSSNWILSAYISVVYLTLIFLGQIFMKGRPPFQLRSLLSLWNFALAIFSILGALRTVPELLYILRDFHNQATAYWGLLFTLSKAFELGDTLFIILRKQPLIFLHWYHHITVMGYTWYTYNAYDSTSRWFMVMNYIVHSLMYTYYGLKSRRIAVPRVISMIITVLQLSQMVLGVVVNSYAVYSKSISEPCSVESNHIRLAFLMYFSYFILFANFFYRAYFKNLKQKGQ